WRGYQDDRGGCHEHPAGTRIFRAHDTLRMPQQNTGQHLRTRALSEPCRTRNTQGFNVIGKPATLITTVSLTAARAWFSQPSSSAKRRVSGSIPMVPKPTSLLTITSSPG